MAIPALNGQTAWQYRAQDHLLDNLLPQSRPCCTESQRSVPTPSQLALQSTMRLEVIAITVRCKNRRIIRRICLGLLYNSASGIVKGIQSSIRRSGVGIKSILGSM